MKNSRNIKEYNLGDIGDIVTGTTPSTKDGKSWIGEIDFLTPTDIDLYDYDPKVSRKVNGEINTRYTSKIIRDEALAVVCIGATIGKLARINRPTLTNQQINAILPYKEIADRDFLFYYLTLYESYFRRLAGGSATPLIVKSDFEKIKIQLPDPKTQKKISKFLTKFDELIAENKTLLQDLNRLASAIYSYWFLQYDFSDSNNRAYSSNGGKLKFNAELNLEIPDDWEVSKLNKFVEIVTGYSFNSKDYKKNGIFGVVTIKNVKDEILDLSNQNYVDIDINSFPKQFMLNEGDVLISLTGNVGRVAIVHTSNQLLNQRVGKLIPNKHFRNFVYLYLIRPETKKRLINIANGSSQDNLSPGDVFNDLIPIPPTDCLEKFDMQINPIMQNILLIQNQVNSLVAFRNKLLPLILNQKIKI